MTLLRHRVLPPGLLPRLALGVACPDPATDDDDAGDDDDSTAGVDDDDAVDDDDSAPVNRPPEITTDPVTPFELTLATPSAFTADQMFLSSSRTDEIRVYDTATLDFVQAFTHALFSDPVSDVFTFGPNGVAFNERGNLVVAAYTAFVEFSDYGVEYATYPKVTDEATENVLFDRLGNLYTTTATGGSDLLNQYDAAGYAFVQTISLPAGAGQLTGITFDDQDRLYVASQSDNTIHVAEADPTFTTFTWVDTISGAGNPGGLEGMQFNGNGDLIVAAGDMAVYDVSTGTRTRTFDSPDDAFPVPVRVDNEGSIYTADYENGGGTAAADIFKFTADGTSWITRNDPGLFGPFGGAISGTVLAGDPPVEYVYAAAAVDPDDDPLTWALLSGPPGMALDAAGVLSWWVTSAQLGSHPVEIEVSDGRGGTDTQSFALEIVGAAP